MIKKLPLEKQLDAMDKLLDKYRITEDMIDKMGDTTLGVWNRIKETTSVVLRDMGAPALNVVSDFLKKVLSKLESGELDRFANVGARWIKSILSGLTNGVMSIYEWFNTITLSPEFQKQTTLFGKVDFLMSDIYDNFKLWYDDGGSQAINKIAQDVTGFLADSLNANIPRLIDVGVKIGAGIGKGIMDGIGQRVTGQIDVSGLKTSDIVNTSDYLLSPSDIGNPPKKNGGLDHVPYDGAIYSLHKGEKILPRGEAAEYRNGNGGGGSGVTINIANMQVREEADIDRVGQAIFQRIYRAAEAGA